MPQDAVRQVPLGDIFAEDELGQMIALYRSQDSAIFHRLVKRRFIEPNRARIEAVIGEFDADYLAYAVEFAFTQATEQDEVERTTDHRRARHGH